MNFTQHKIILAIYLTIISAGIFSQNIPSHRVTDWSKSGAACLNFNDSVSVMDFGGDSTGVSSNNIALANSLAAISNEGVIYFPAGTYFFDQSISLPSNVHLMGEGADLTQFNFDLGGNSSFLRVVGSVNSNIDTVTSVLLKDDRFIDVSDKSIYQVNDVIRIVEDDAGRMESIWASNTIGQILKIDSISSSQNRLFVSQPLHLNFDGLNYPRIQKIIPKENIKISCLTLNRQDATAGQTSSLYFNYAINCVVEGVASYNSNFSHLELNNSTQITVQNSYFKDGHAYGSGGQGYGLVLQVSSCNNLIQNNVFNHLRHSILLQSSANGNVIAYNYSIDPYWTSVFLPSNSAGDIVLHGNYPFLNLFEGNICQNIVIDNSHGINGPYNTFLRNSAELYGLFMNTSPASDAQNFIGNEITNTSGLYGMYTLEGIDHFEFGNNHKGTITPAGTEQVTINSLFLTYQPYYWNFNQTPFPSFGYPADYNVNSLAAKDRFDNGELAYCDELPIAATINKCNNEPTNFFGVNYTSAGFYNLNIVNGNCEVPMIIDVVDLPNSTIVQQNDSLFATLSGVSYEWFLDGVSTGSSENYFVPMQDGVYTVEVLQTNGNECLSNEFEIIGSGITQLSESFELFPNPSSGVITVYSRGLNLQIQSIEVVNELGEIIFKDNMALNHSYSFNVESFSKGIYFLKIETEKGLVMKKIVRN
jgi:hypothetical protein